MPNRVTIDPHPVLKTVAGGTRDFLRGLCKKAVRHAQHVTGTVRMGNDTINVLNVARIHVAAPNQAPPTTEDLYPHPNNPNQETNGPTSQ